jgi:hypothetical protein
MVGHGKTTILYIMYDWLYLVNVPLAIESKDKKTVITNLMIVSHRNYVHSEY